MLLENLKKQDWILNGAILFLGLAGLFSFLSSDKNFFYQQLLWYLIGLGIAAIISLIDWRPIFNSRRFIGGAYVLAIIFLAVTFLFAPTIRGIRSWLVFGPLQFQPSEFAKLALIIIFSSFWAKAHVSVAHLKNLIISFGYFLIPAIFVAVQPDLGSALILFSIWFGYLLISGIRWKHLFIAAIIFVIVGFIFWTNILADYQKDRILGLFNPESDPLGRNYSVIQSKIAIGSAGFWGKGFQQGTQLQLGFLPEAQTDFIFAAFTEEFGLLGGFSVLAAFIILIFRLIKIGLMGENNFAKMLCLGTIVLFASHFILNVGSNLGLVPVIGVPFPFFSYGGSSLLINLMIIGLIQGTVIRSKL